MEKKKPSFIRNILYVLVGLLLTIIIFIAYVFVSMQQEKIMNDNINEIINKHDIDINERIIVDENNKLNLRIDESDLYYILIQNYGSNFIDDNLKAIKENSDFEILNYDLKIDDGKPKLNLTVKYKGLKLSGEATIKLDVNDNEIIGSLEKIKVAGMSFKTARFNLDNFKISLKVDTYFLKTIEEIKGEDNYLYLIGELNDEIIKYFDPTNKYDPSFIYYIDDAREILDAGKYISIDKEKAIDIFKKGIKEKGFDKVIEDVFSVAFPASSNEIMKNDFLKERLLNKYAETNFVDMYRINANIADNGKRDIVSLCERAYQAYNLKELKIKDGKFYFNDNVFKYEDFIFEGWEETFKQYLKADTFKLVLVDDPKAFTGDVGPLSKHIDSLDSLEKNMNINGRYTIGILFESSGSCKLLVYNTKTSGKLGFDFITYEISDEQFNELNKANKVPVYVAY